MKNINLDEKIKNLGLSARAQKYLLVNYGIMTVNELVYRGMRDLLNHGGLKTKTTRREIMAIMKQKDLKFDEDLSKEKLMVRHFLRDELLAKRREESGVELTDSPAVLLGHNGSITNIDKLYFAKYQIKSIDNLLEQGISYEHFPLTKIIPLKNLLLLCGYRTDEDLQYAGTEYALAELEKRKRCRAEIALRQKYEKELLDTYLMLLENGNDIPSFQAYLDIITSQNAAKVNVPNDGDYSKLSKNITSLYRKIIYMDRLTEAYDQFLETGNLEVFETSHIPQSHQKSPLKLERRKH